MSLFIITVTKAGVITRIQMEPETSVRNFCWWVLNKGYTVRLRVGETVKLSDQEQSRSVSLVHDFSMERNK